MVAVALGMVSCNRTEQDAGEVVRFASVPVSLSDGEGDQFASGDTRSQVSIDSEEFVSAYLFAFDATTKKVLTYPTSWEDHQGENGGVVALFTEEANFDWALPVGRAFDVWAVVNPGTQYEAFLNSCLTNPTLTENNPYGEAMVFSCPSSSALKQLDVETMGTGIPMSGRLDNHTLSSATQGVTIPVEHLFAKYEIRFGFDDYVAQGYTVNAWAIRASKSNTEVPFFWNGDFSQTNPSKLNVVDYGTLNDLVLLNQGERATLYFLENCHGTKSGVRDWNTVYEDLNSNNPDLDYCSYIEVAVNVTRQATATTPAVDESNIHRVYVGDTFLNRTAGTYNFDVKRNMYRKIKINLGPETPEAAFKFTNSSTLTVAPGETVTVPFVCKGITSEELEFDSSNSSELSVYGKYTFTQTSTTIGGVTYTHSGTVTYRASNDANGDYYIISGGKNLGSEYETKGVESVYMNNDPYIPENKGELWVEWRLSERNGSAAQYTFYTEDTSFSGVLCFKIDGTLTVPSYDSHDRTYSEICWPVSFTNGVGTFFSMYPVDLSNTGHTFSGVVQFVSNASQNVLQGYQTVMIWPKNRRTLPTDTNTDKYPLRFTAQGVNLQGGNLVNIPFKTGRTNAEITGPSAFGLSNEQEVEIVSVTYNANTSASNLFPHSGYVTLRAKTTNFSSSNATLSSIYWSIPEYEDDINVTLVTNSVLSVSNYWMSQLNGNTMTVTFYFTANDNQFNGSLGAKSNVTVTNVSNGSTIYREQDKSITLNFTNGQAEYSVSFSATGNLNFNVSRSFSATTLPSGYSSVVFN